MPIISLQIKNFHKGNSEYLEYPCCQHLFKAKKSEYPIDSSFVKECIKIWDISLVFESFSEIYPKDNNLGIFTEMLHQDVFGDKFSFEEFFEEPKTIPKRKSRSVYFDARGYHGWLFETETEWLLRVCVDYY